MLVCSRTWLQARTAAADVDTLHSRSEQLTSLCFRAYWQPSPVLQAGAATIAAHTLNGRSQQKKSALCLHARLQPSPVLQDFPLAIDPHRPLFSCKKAVCFAVVGRCSGGSDFPTKGGSPSFMQVCESERQCCAVRTYFDFET
eukprot:360716-Chlamydomonas_euryale.AAC.1